MTPSKPSRLPLKERLKQILSWWRTWAIAVPVVVGFYFLSRTFNIDAVHAYAEKLNGVLAFAL